MFISVFMFRLFLGVKHTTSYHLSSYSRESSQTFGLVCINFNKTICVSWIISYYNGRRPRKSKIHDLVEYEHNKTQRIDNNFFMRFRVPNHYFEIKNVVSVLPVFTPITHFLSRETKYILDPWIQIRSDAKTKEDIKTLKRENLTVYLFSLLLCLFRVDQNWGSWPFIVYSEGEC